MSRSTGVVQPGSSAVANLHFAVVLLAPTNPVAGSDSGSQSCQSQPPVRKLHSPPPTTTRRCCNSNRPHPNNAQTTRPTLARCRHHRSAISRIALLDSCFLDLSRYFAPSFGGLVAPPATGFRRRHLSHDINRRSTPSSQPPSHLCLRRALAPFGDLRDLRDGAFRHARSRLELTEAPSTRPLWVSPASSIHGSVSHAIAASRSG